MSAAATCILWAVQDETIRSALRYTLGRVSGNARRRGGRLAETHVAVFEIEELMALKEQPAIPVLLYLFRRVDRSLKGQPAYLLLDEAWVMLGHPVFRAKSREWLEGSAQGQLCCGAGDAEPVGRGPSGILDVLIESCRVRYSCPMRSRHRRHAGASGPRDLYERWVSNETQIRSSGAASKSGITIVSLKGAASSTLVLSGCHCRSPGIQLEGADRPFAGLAQRVRAWPFACCREQGVEYASLPVIVQRL